MSYAEPTRKQRWLAGAAVLIVVALVAVELFFPESPVSEIVRIVDANYVRSVLRLAVPIAFAALGGIFAEKSGVINIGLEGLLIISAFTSIAVAGTISGGSPTQVELWVGFVVAVLTSVLFALLFAVVCIEFKADQIIAGLAVWLIALGLAPFASKVIWGQVNSPRVATLGSLNLGVVEVSPPVVMMLVSVPA